MKQLYHERLLRILPDRELIKTHTFCCETRSNEYDDWNWKPSDRKYDWNYIFKYPQHKFCAYHWKVLIMMDFRNIPHAVSWYNPSFRGLSCPPGPVILPEVMIEEFGLETIYSEHTEDRYIDELNALIADMSEKLNSRRLTPQGLKDKKWYDMLLVERDMYNKLI